MSSLNFQKQYFQDVFQIVEEALFYHSNLTLFLESGHFNNKYGVTEFAESSLKSALEMGKELKEQFGDRINIVMGVLIDDLGLECSENVCTTLLLNALNVQESGKELPRKLEDILYQNSIFPRNELIISSERACKNRGIPRLKKIVRSENRDNIYIKTDELLNTQVFFRDDEENPILLAEFASNSWQWKARCPTIMGQHYSDIFTSIQKRFPKSQKIMIIDWLEMLNYAKVTAGAKAALSVFQVEGISSLDLDIINIFLGDSSGEIYDVFHSCNQLVHV